MFLTKDLMPLVVPLVALQPPRLHLILELSKNGWSLLLRSCSSHMTDLRSRTKMVGHSRLRATQLLSLPGTEAPVKAALLT